VVRARGESRAATAAIGGQHRLAIATAAGPSWSWFEIAAARAEIGTPWPATLAATPTSATHRDLLLVQQLLDPAQRAAQGLRIGPQAAQGQRGYELGSDGIRYGLQRFRCVSLHSAALHCVRCAID
jgi:hypothetical protein